MGYQITPQPELRALDVLDTVPKGCIAFEDEDGFCEPHVKRGEQAIVDINDRDPQHGEIFLFQWTRKRSILQAAVYNEDIGNGPEPTWWVRPMPGCSRLVASDGPFSDTEYLKSKIVGRVVGVITR